jgi:hypothetical protein
MIRTAIASGHFVPLLTRHSIYLQVDASDGRRFARVFQATWRRIPLRDRRRLLGYWKADGPEHGIALSPRVHLVERNEFPTDDESVVGVTSDLGHRLQFPAKVVDRMPDAVAEDLIAHELAHAFQMATGIRPFIYPDGYEQFICADGERWDRDLLEYHADVIAERWGFDTNSVDQWDPMNREPVKKSAAYNKGEAQGIRGGAGDESAKAPQASPSRDPSAHRSGSPFGTGSCLRDRPSRVPRRAPSPRRARPRRPTAPLGP